MTEKQNAGMLELARALEVQLHSHSPLTLTSSTVREIVAALRTAAPSPHPRGEPVAWQRFVIDSNQWVIIYDTSDKNLNGLKISGWKIRPLYAAPPPAVTTREDPVAWRWKPRGANGYFLELEKPAHGTAEPLFLSAPPPAGADARREQRDRWAKDPI